MTSALDQIRVSLVYSALAIVPSDTCFALAVHARDRRAVRALRLALGVEAPLSVVFASVDQFHQYADLGQAGRRLGSHLLPGPLTVVAPLSENGERHVASNLHGGTTIGGRVSDSAVEGQIVEAMGGPITTTAIRDDRGDVITNLTDAIDIVTSGLDRAGDELGYAPILQVVEPREFLYSEASTVIRINPRGLRTEHLRPGPVEADAIAAAVRKTCPWEWEDGT